MTTEERLNLNSAISLAASQTGLTTYMVGDVKRANLENVPYETENAYLAALKNIILSYPARFDAMTVNNAKATNVSAYALQEYSVGDAVSEFTNEVIDQAGELAQDVKKSFTFGIGAFVVIGLLLATSSIWLPQVKKALTSPAAK